MKVLLDECVPRKFKFHLPGHECQTVAEAGMAGKRNGQLLDLAQRQEFDVFLTIDQGIQYQQNLTNRKIAVVIVRAKSNRLSDVAPLAPECLEALASVLPGQLVLIGR